jgi:hypothetical protein
MSTRWLAWPKLTAGERGGVEPVGRSWTIAAFATEDVSIIAAAVI